MLKQEEIQKIREEDQKKIAKISGMADDIVTQRVDMIRERARSLKDELQSKIDKKHELLRSPITKAEVLEMCLAGLRENREKYFFEGILSHLKDVQIQRAAPLRPEDFRVHQFAIEQLWKLAYSVISEEDLKKAVKMLPDIGISCAERDKEIARLDGEIAALEDQIEKELRKV